ncbi:unnamed protein product [Cylindrotheca closterium]|uniref:Uncharacterized protein n=1 Tax=Cylindrotheca closterium TaxID=2856 RepID=A0AAD2CPV2_9STRA|nr:unnamed protein product [Cylindrotheca closterium]
MEDSLEVKPGSEPANFEKEKPQDDEEDTIVEHEKYGMREIVIPVGDKEIRFNPVTSVFAIAFLWGLAVWCMTDPEFSRDKLVEFRGNVAELFTWFYVGTNPAFMFFILWVAYRYGNIRLGPQDSTPEFDDITYFSMLFSAGVGVGLFFYGVAEPLWHRGSHWFAETGYKAQDEIDMFALNITVFHWGITGWSQYLIVAICSGLVSFRFKLPLTLRSCFYPLLGEYTWGWIGDIIDGYTIVTTVAGVCTSLGLGAFQIAAGLKRVGAIDKDISDDDLTDVHLYSIWIITCLATISVISGVGIGIKYLSQLAFGLGQLLLFWVFTMEKTNFILNLIVQEVGYYFQWTVFQMNFHTDAFGQLNHGEGRAVDGNSAATWFMDAWTIFYIGWWVAWAAFVGLFIARVSRGRTIRNVIFYSYACPLIYTIIWFCVFGGVGLRQVRQAEELQMMGLAMHNNSDFYQSAGDEFCYDVPQVPEISYTALDNSTATFTNTLMGVTPVCLFNSGDDQTAWFNVLNSFTYPNDFSGSGFGPFLTWVSIFSLSIYFITSSDSGSLVVDQLASNGFEDAHWLQRVFWAFTEGGAASALLVSGGQSALRALQAASILSGLPFTFFLMLMCLTIVSMCKLAEENDKEGTDLSLEEDYHRKRTFTMPIFGGIFNIFERVFSFGMTNEKRSSIATINGSDISGFFVAILFPFIPLNNIYGMARPKSSNAIGNKVMVFFYTIFYYLTVGLFCSIGQSPAFRGIGWSTMALAALILCSIRMTVRDNNKIEGNVIADFVCSMFLWPQVLVQMEKELTEKNNTPTEEDEVGQEKPYVEKAAA